MLLLPLKDGGGGGGELWGGGNKQLGKEKDRMLRDAGKRGSRSRNSLAGESIYTMYEVTVAAIHTVGLLCVVAFSGVA